MHVIEAHFEDIDEIAVAQLFGAVGTYVLWAPQATRRPSYIGEGKILHRFTAEHIERFGTGARGCVAPLWEGSARRRKLDAEIVEAALFLVGEEIGLAPTHNKAPGKWRGLEALWEARHNQVRVNISGMHPLRLGSRLSSGQRVTLQLESDDDDGFLVTTKHPWRRT